MSSSNFWSTEAPSSIPATDPIYYNCRASREEDAMEELRVIFHQESTKYSINFDYFSIECRNDQPVLNERVSDGWRRKICEWLFEVVDHFQFDREVVSIALYYLDRVVSIQTEELGQAMHRREFQLIAVTSLYIAIKLHGEIQPDSHDWPRRKLKIQVFVELSRGLFTVKTLEAKEREILKMLNWHVNPTTAARIVAILLRLFPERWTMCDNNTTLHSNPRSTIFEMARYLTELAVCVSAVSFNYKPSEIAYASIICALEALENETHIPCDVRVEYLNKATLCTGLTPQSVATVCTLLQDLCPAMFSKDDDATALNIARTNGRNITASSEIIEENGKVSPVCVVSLCQTDSSSRKRGRTY
mmetsp:Transcript_23023/g.25387  ORF Transcript_23023/g.25387 Transcript_23023/m.25387 type:complete len:360 (-) Transcript_23023:272-1351(-)